ncbi:glycosyl transferase group 1 [Desulfatibacillum aliphaticivorans]|uniref:Glycosyl transferase group 1 n=1 Tax=Desulfatibacillum aliphaticivorans TaxID=218208 RepID=B8FKA7_DESAL|nr:glycosyltransferase family 4 protein [Desulfatibacillum aliphaticivorans]ACL01722.1 glycosyl transferase group 1 [Desulfatibacillum aliphaticivorans]
MIRKKILISDTAPLYPPMWGGPKRIWGLFSNLTHKYDIIYVGVDTGQYELVKGIEASEDFFEKRFSMPESYYKYWLPIYERLFKNLNFDPYTYFFIDNAKHYVDALESQPADAIVCSHPWSWNTLKYRTDSPVIYDAHNCEYTLMRSLAEGNLFKPILTHKTKVLEGDLCRRAKVILACSEEDKQAFVDVYKLDPGKISIVENGTDIPPLPSLKERVAAREELGYARQPVVLFVGAYYKPNIQAVDFIVNRLAPKLPACQFVIVGTVTNAFSDSQAPENVSFAGILTDDYLEHYWRAADLAVNPMSKGSGVNIKMLDYMAAGIPTVSTPFGCRGLDVENEKHVVISELDNFATAIWDTLKNPELRGLMRKKGYDYVSTKFDWKILSKKVEHILDQLLFDR